MRLNRIGFSRYITLEWLNETARLTQELETPEEIKQTLNQIIYEIEAEEAKRKTIDVLTRTWARVDESHKRLRDEALNFLNTVNPQEMIILHWGLLIIAYPIFHDVTASIGRLSNLQGAVTVNQIKRSIKKDWGDRTTLNRTVDRIVQSLLNWNIIQQTDKTYIPTKQIKTKKIELQTWLLNTIIEHNKPSPINYQDLTNAPTLFPYQLNITIRQLQERTDIEIINQGSNTHLLKRR